MLTLLAASDPAGHVVDQHINLLGIPITMHTVTLLGVSALFLWAMTRAAKGIATGPESEGNERYITKGRFAQVVEAITVYLRDQMLIPVMGEHHARKYLPFLMSLFFFILFMNLFGLVPILDMLHLAGVHTPPIGGTATASITVTGALAIIAFIVIQVHAFRENGVKGWIVHHFGGLVPGPIYLFPVALLVFVVEVAGDFIKPAALAIRLFANMVAGHILMAVLLGFGKMAMDMGAGPMGVAGVSAVTGIVAVLITFLEVFVAFLQAFIFMFLTAVFISLMSHHGEHDHDEEHGHEHAAHAAA